MSRRLWLAAAVCSVVLLAACGASNGKASQAKAGHAATGQANTGQVAGNPCVPGSCGVGISNTTTTTQATNSRPRATSALQAWGAAHLASLQALSGQASHLLAGAGDADQVKLACSQLGSQAQAALAAPPPPDATTAARLRSGLTQLGQLSRDCAAAFSSGDTTAASRLVYEANQATAAIDQVVQVVTGAGHPLS